MTRYWTITAASILGLVSVMSANAQTYGPASATPPEASVNPWFTGRHASTELEGALNGHARLLHAKGLYNQLTADAFNRWQEGYSKYLENETNRVHAYFKIKQINADYRAAKAPPPLTKEKLDQWNVMDQPDRLSRRQYNSDTGNLEWPAVLQAQLFDQHRLYLSDLFARRTAGEFGVNSPFYQQVNMSTTRMKDTLKAYLRSEDKWFSDQEYIAAQNFLNSLTQEARLAPDLDGLAAN
jgi:hypothetical protein